MSDPFHPAIGTGQKTLDRFGRIVYSHGAGMKTRKASGQAFDGVPFEEQWCVGPVRAVQSIQMSSEASPRHDSRTGGLAQLGERRVRNAEVEGSNPLPSTRCVLILESCDLARDGVLFSVR